MNAEDIATVTEYTTEACNKACLTPEQTAQVIDFRLDPWWCNSDRQADTIIEFFKRLNEKEDERRYEAMQIRYGDTFDHACGGVLCPEHGDPRLNSVDYTRLGMAVRA